MDEPTLVSWLLMEQLAARVRDITRAKGCFSDLGTYPVVLDDEDLPRDQIGTVIEAREFEITHASAGRLDYDATITIEFAVPKRGDGNPKRLLQAAALDLSRAMQLKPKQLPTGVRTFEPEAALLFLGEDADGAPYLIAQVTARAGLTETTSPGAT